ncbi:uncharacterized protein MELLADRAFT_107327 [Melampsora larici-populina 98AG31]|uniref:Uncharacterized protein n=1 Tax=Melampsora larici-populina (strain 98AG31 / pathotype 3-4-7) TaxID=747676 RepID=F4RNY9_MELLP|nr:uncharacterized protein MELLADRAFT_107327 [Melampsora larici-populina 98AG31]EGG05833.1 hypothetical protein MELLADRAFT_107327 [Melampsora larici-populina 98AG31]
MNSPVTFMLQSIKQGTLTGQFGTVGGYFANFLRWYCVPEGKNSATEERHIGKVIMQALIFSSTTSSTPCLQPKEIPGLASFKGRVATVRTFYQNWCCQGTASHEGWALTRAVIIEYVTHASTCTDVDLLACLSTSVMVNYLLSQHISLEGEGYKGGP